MVTTKVLYQGHKHCLLTHGPSGSTIETDAPKDNQGKGERFSPTDLVGAALASCVVTTMAIVAEREGIPFTNASAEVEKHMVAEPRRIGALPLRITLPALLTHEQRAKLEHIANHCPVHESLHPDLKVVVTFLYV